MPVEELTVPVSGGRLAALRWPAADPAAPTVVASHGMLANAEAWALVAEALAGRVALVAPDLRGRARSAALPGPFGLARHAADVLELTRGLTDGPVVLAGHSMGAWVTALAAADAPELVRAVVLVDGGVSLPPPAGVPRNQVLATVLGPSLARLALTFPSLDAYRDYWAAHPVWPSIEPAVRERYIARDLVGSGERLRSSCTPEAAQTDGLQVLLDADAAAAVRRLRCPAELIWAERGLLDQPTGFYDEQRLAEADLAATTLTTSRLPDSNHYSVLMGRAGAALVAERILAAAAG
ncbi:alpha/beta hydrolase [Kitasatospora viridis]|uniref:Alpha/beta hydrolase family protein n=1 Tax=Kitasatospora viridis TaxID=281105 RepID=A0A561UKF0_9ACTN|nr:alpha/beta fold hydrolase [Kitasatospora viridis]TWF99842.1 alpha/beta hydrolase family protein [Kitasatospora viridis]